LKRPKINEKEAGVGPFLKNLHRYKVRPDNETLRHKKCILSNDGREKDFKIKFLNWVRDKK